MLPDDGVSSDDRYADLLPTPQGDLQIAQHKSLVVAASAFRKLPGPVRWARPWPVWRCWLGTTTCHFVET